MHRRNTLEDNFHKAKLQPDEEIIIPQDHSYTISWDAIFDYDPRIGCEPSNLLYGRIPFNVLEHKLAISPIKVFANH